jgi:uncharacterized protein RhaS with RHS repeats
MPLVQSEAQSLLAASLGQTAYTAVSGPVVALVTDGTDPTATAAGSEVTGGSYARQPFTPSTASAATPSVISNTNAISFTAMPAGNVKSINIYNSSTRRLYYGPLGTLKALGLGDTLSFAIGAITVSMQ